MLSNLKDFTKCRPFFVIVLMLISTALSSQDIIKIIGADHHFIQYYGRFDHTNIKAPRVWAPGAYITTRFSGSDCEIFLNDQVFEGSSHNYIEVKVDNIDPVRIRLRARTNRIQIAKDLPGGDHTITITKNTDASVGYLELIGFNCNSLLPPPPVPMRKIEFIGDDMTAGTGSDNRYMPCDSAEWYDQSNAYSSFGPLTARNVNAQYQLTAATGIGLTKTAGEPAINIRTAFDKMNVYKNALAWDFKRYQPDVVTICIGQNDALADSNAFINNYISFLKDVRQKYPVAQIVCMVISRGDVKSLKLKNAIPLIVAGARRAGDARVQQLVINGDFNKGCNNLPSLDEHLEIAGQLTVFVKRLMAW
jgi:lysophospholipase L1-like esterase